MAREAEPVEGAGAVAFHRPAREFPEPVPSEPVTVAAPPTVPPPDRPIWQMLLPAMAGLGIVGFAFIYGNVLFIAVAGGIALITVVGSVAIGVHSRRSTRKQRRHNAARYRDYLVRQRQTLEVIAATQRAAADRLHPGPDRALQVAATRAGLWERRRDDADFLHARLGLGRVPLQTPVAMDLSTDPLTEYETDLLAEARTLVDDFRSLDGLPVVAPLRGLGVVAVTGDRRATQALARAVLLELACWHPPDDLELTAWFPPAQTAAWEWLKWLPHARAADGDADTLAVTTDPADLEVLLTALVPPRQAHLDRLRNERPGVTSPEEVSKVSFKPAVVLLDGYDPTSPVGRLGLVDQVLEHAADLGILVLVLVDHRGQIPSSAAGLIELSADNRLAWTEGRPGGQRERGVRPDAITPARAEDAARALAPLVLRGRRARTDTVDSQGLLDLLGEPGRAAPPTAAPGAQPANRPLDTLLATPIGIGDDAAPVVMDLKEAAEGGMGPHGLVVGATGSGKSELLRTLVTGLAATHTPEELALVLVDFKGGATFAELDELPHVAGVITNLERDLTLVDRMHEALFGELERRQRVLAAAGLDRVRDYQAARVTDPTLEPLPSLLVIVDEFGELLTARPDFMDLFVSIGRTGRSLGVHLLLSTQRLDEGRIRGLEGHLRYRACLRTFSADESLVALGTRAAFELPPLPGLGYLKVDGAMQRFKAALASRPYRGSSAPVHTPGVIRAFGVRGDPATLAVLGDPTAATPSTERGKVTTERGEGRGPRGAGTPGGPRVRTDLQVVVETQTSRHARRARQVWLPPLPAVIPLDAVLGGDRGARDADRGGRMDPGVGSGIGSGMDRGAARLLEDMPPDGARPGTPEWLRVPLGLEDRPRDQAQVPLELELSGSGGHLAVIGAPRTGKSTLLATLIAGLAVTHHPADVQVYAADLGGGGLHALAGLPHVGAVCGRGDAERLQRLVRELRTIVARRSADFRDHQLDSMVAHHAARRAGRLPGARHGEVFLVVDNWALFAGDHPELGEAVLELAAAGLHYGVHVVVTANRWHDLRMALRDNLGGRVELRLNDPIESEIDRHGARALPADVPGRGLARDGARIQVALPRIDGIADSSGLAVGLERLVAAAAARWDGASPAPPIRALPARVDQAALPPAVTDPGPGVAIGLEEFDLSPVRVDLFDSDPHLLVLGDGECGKTTLLRGLMHRLAARHPPEDVRLAVVDYRRQLADDAAALGATGYAYTPESAAALVEQLRGELTARLPQTDLSATLRGPRPWSGPRIVLVVDDHDLVASTTSNPLAALADLLAMGRDIGFHLVLARRVGGFARGSFEPVVQRLRELGTPGLIMSGDPQEGPLLSGVKAAPLPPGRGHLVRRRATVLVQVALADPSGATWPAAADPPPDQHARDPLQQHANPSGGW